MQMMPVRKESWEELAEGARVEARAEGGTKEEERQSKTRPGRGKPPEAPDS